jgi:hypothetical protein
MAREDESLPMRLLRQPMVWSGIGLLVRYAGEPTDRATIWTGLGVLSLGIGVAYSIATLPVVPVSRQLP